MPKAVAHSALLSTAWLGVSWTGARSWRWQRSNDLEPPRGEGEGDRVSGSFGGTLRRTRSYLLRRGKAVADGGRRRRWTTWYSHHRRHEDDEDDKWGHLVRGCEGEERERLALEMGRAAGRPNVGERKACAQWAGDGPLREEETGRGVGQEEGGEEIEPVTIFPFMKSYSFFPELN